MVGDTVGFCYECDWNIQFFDLFLEKLRFICHTASEKVYDFNIVIAYHTFRTQFKQVVSLCKLAELLDIDLKNAGKPEMANLPDKLRAYGAEKAAAECGVGVPTLQDIVKELVKPGRDPRDELPAPILRTDVLELKDLKPGMVLSGTVRNVIDFGVFVDIGVHQDGLVHISQVSNKFIKHPSEVVSVGDVVKVAVLDVDQKRGRISLTMKGAK